MCIYIFNRTSFPSLAYYIASIYIYIYIYTHTIYETANKNKTDIVDGLRKLEQFYKNKNKEKETEYQMEYKSDQVLKNVEERNRLLTKVETRDSFGELLTIFKNAETRKLNMMKSRNENSDSDSEDEIEKFMSQNETNLDEITQELQNLKIVNENQINMQSTQSEVEQQQQQQETSTSRNHIDPPEIHRRARDQEIRRQRNLIREDSSSISRAIFDISYKKPKTYVKEFIPLH